MLDKINEAKKFINVRSPFKLSDMRISSLLYKLIVEKIGKFLFSNALGGSLGFFSRRIKIEKNEQIVIKTIKGIINVTLFIF